MSVNVLTGMTSGTLFNSFVQQSAVMENLANTALSNGIDRYTEKDYDGAISEFQRAVALYSSHSSDSGNAVNAANYMGQSYLKLGDTDSAIEAYERSISLDNTNDATHTTLGNLFHSQGRYEEAVSEYQEAVRLKPTADSYYSLGQGYLSLGKYGEAEVAFNKVKQLEPTESNGDYGLGLVYSKQGNYDDAIVQFKEAIASEEDLYYAYADLGYAYADSGQFEEAYDVLEFLEDEDEDLADTLEQYINKVDPPKLLAGSSTNFTYVMGIKTPLSSLNAYLLNADAEMTFSMQLSFNKDMDRASVENVYNWEISRASGAGFGDEYNFGLDIPSTEVELSTYPDYVYYDADTNTATVKFTIQQNEDGDGTIDPSHIVFKFNGTDMEGLAMDSDYDEFSGFSGVA